MSPTCPRVEEIRVILYVYPQYSLPYIFDALHELFFFRSQLQRHFVFAGLEEVLGIYHLAVHFQSLDVELEIRMEL